MCVRAYVCVNTPMGMKGLELPLGSETPMPLTAKTRISYITPSIILLASYVVPSNASKFSLVQREEPTFFLSIRYPGGGVTFRGGTGLCVCVCVCFLVFVCVCVYVCLCMCVFTFCLYIFLYVRARVCLCSFECLCVCIM